MGRTPRTRSAARRRTTTRSQARSRSTARRRGTTRTTGPKRAASRGRGTRSRERFVSFHQTSGRVGLTTLSVQHVGELSVSAGEDLVILEASDANWYLVANASGQRGLMPSSYLAG